MKLKLGDEVRITFQDHSQHAGIDGGLLIFNTYGKVMAISKSTVIIASWCYPNLDVDDNVECFSISRGSILKVRVFR